MAKTQGYIVTVEVFVPSEYVEAMNRGMSNSESEIASFEVGDALDDANLGYEILHVMKV